MAQNIDKPPHYHVVADDWSKTVVAWTHNRNRAHHMARTQTYGNRDLKVVTCFYPNCDVIRADRSRR